MKARVSSAVIMMAITVLCMALGRVTRVLYFAACACICAYELYKNLKDKDVLCAFFVFIAYVLGDSVIVMACSFCFLCHAFRHNKPQNRRKRRFFYSISSSLSSVFILAYFAHRFF